MSQDLLELMKAPPADSRRTSGGLEKEYAEPYQAWKQNPTPDTASALVRAVHPVIESAVRPLGNSPALYGRARRMAMDAIGNYDPTRAGLRTHLMNNLQGLKRIAGQQAMPIQIPERAMLQQHELYRATNDLSDELGREPSDAELADRTGLSSRRISHLRNIRMPVSESAASWEAPDGSLSSPAVQDDDPQMVLENFVYHELTPRDQLLLDYALGRNGREKLPGREIAVRLGITPGAVSQRLSGIQQRLNSMRDMELFGG